MKTIFRFIVVSMLAGLMAAPPAFAQLEEIIVTATRRAESLQDVPISVTAVTGETILEGGFSDMEDLSAFVPNLYMRDSFTGQRLAIRGIGTDTSNEAFEQAVAQFHDGVYYGRDNLGQNAFFDLERVEVVRGPQPTFAGQSATAGALNYVSRRPGDQLEGRISAEYGSDEETSIEFAVGGPISDTFGIRVAGRSYELNDAGYTDVTTGNPLGIKDNSGFRVTGVWEPSDRVEVTFKYERSEVWQIGTPREHTRCEIRPEYSLAHGGLTTGFPAVCAMEALHNGATLDVIDGLTGTGGSQDVWDVSEALDAQFGYTPGDKTRGGVSFTPVACMEQYVRGCAKIARGLNNVVEYGYDEEREHQSDVFLLDVNWDVGDYTLVATASSVTYDKHDWLDPDGGTMAIFTDERIETFDQSALEFRVQSPVDQRFNWMLGGYWQTSDLYTVIDVFLPQYLGPFRPVPEIAVSYGSELDEKATWRSLFFAGSLNVTDQFRFNFGGRMQDIQKDGVIIPTTAFLYPGQNSFYPNGRMRNHGPSVPGNADADDILPEVGIEWDVGPNSMFYAKYSEALKAGGFVMVPAIGGMIPNPFTYRPEYAQGIEIGLKSLLANDTLEVNLALYDVDYTDLQVSIFQQAQSVFITENAAAAHTTGIEIDGRWAPSDRFTMSFSAASNEAQYDDYDGADCNSLDDKLFAQRTGRPRSQCFNDLQGVTLPFSPEWVVNVSPEILFSAGELQGRLGANVLFSDGYTTNNDFDPLSVMGSYHRVDVRLAFAPASNAWELALYGRNITDERVRVGGAGNFQSRSSDLTYDAGGATLLRGARWGVQGSYFFGN